MTDTRITRPRRIFVEYIGTVGKATFTDLKANLVGKWEDKMDLTTLYRMIEIFKNQGLIHEVKYQNERIVFLVTDDFNPNRDSVEISICENCGNIETIYEPLPPNFTARSIENRLKSCDKCVIL